MDAEVQAKATVTVAVANADSGMVTRYRDELQRYMCGRSRLKLELPWSLRLFPAPLRIPPLMLQISRYTPGCSVVNGTSWYIPHVFFGCLLMWCWRWAGCKDMFWRNTL
jgi:hypothetical protein